MKLKALDGGWGWMIVLGSCLGHFCVVGAARSFGILYVEMKQRYETSARETAWVLSFYNVIRMTLGPISSLVSEKISCRWSVIIGGLLATAGFGLSALATDIYHVYLTFSITGGIGASLVFAPILVIVTQYFDKLKGKAMGFATVGSGLGLVILSPVYQLCLDNLGYQITMVIAAGIMLQCVVAGALMRPLEDNRKARVIDCHEHQNFQEAEMQVIRSGGPDENLLSEDTSEKLPRKSSNGNDTHTCSSEHDIARSVSSRCDADSRHRSNLDTPISHDPCITLDICSSDKEAGLHVKTSLGSCASLEPRTSLDPCTDDKEDLDQPNANAKDKFQGLTLDTTSHIERHPCIERLYLLTNISFLLYLLSMFAMPHCIQCVHMFLPSMTNESGINKGSILMSIGGMADIVGRILSGFIFDIPAVRKYRRPVHSIMGIIMGSLVSLFPFMPNFPALVVLSLAWGIIAGGYHGQRATVLSEFVSVPQQVFAVGWVICAQGIGNFTGGTVAGAIYDMSGSYKYSYIYLGSTLISASVLFLLDYAIKGSRTAGSTGVTTVNANEKHDGK